jgi:hypothetical protein
MIKLEVFDFAKTIKEYMVLKDITSSVDLHARCDADLIPYEFITGLLEDKIAHIEDSELFIARLESISQTLGTTFAQFLLASIKPDSIKSNEKRAFLESALPPFKLLTRLLSDSPKPSTFDTDPPDFSQS